MSINYAKQQHYSLPYEPIKFINFLGLDFNSGNFIKYLTRYKGKGTAKADLEKAKVYLDFCIKYNTTISPNIDEAYIYSKLNKFNYYEELILMLFISDYEKNYQEIQDNLDYLIKQQKNIS